MVSTISLGTALWYLVVRLLGLKVRHGGRGAGQTLSRTQIESGNVDISIDDLDVGGAVFCGDLDHAGSRGSLSAGQNWASLGVSGLGGVFLQDGGGDPEFGGRVVCRDLQGLNQA